MFGRPSKNLYDITASLVKLVKERFRSYDKHIDFIDKEIIELKRQVTVLNCELEELKKQNTDLKAKDTCSSCYSPQKRSYTSPPQAR